MLLTVEVWLDGYQYRARNVTKLLVLPGNKAKKFFWLNFLCDTRIFIETWKVFCIYQIEDYSIE